MKLTFFYLNFCSIQSNEKQDTLKDIINTSNPDVIMITESWLKLDTPDGEDPQVNGYVTVAKDSRVTNTNGGGVLIMAKSHIKVEVIAIGIPQKSFHIQCAKIKVFDQMFALIYRKPDTKPPINDQLFTYLGAEADNNMIIIGDLNFPKIDWETHSGPPSETKFLELLDKRHLVQIITEPTHKKSKKNKQSRADTAGNDNSGNILDLLVVPDPNAILDLENTNHPLITGGNEHNAIIFCMQLGPNKAQKEKIEVEDFKNADMKVFTDKLEKSDWLEKAHDNSITVDELGNKLQQNLLGAWDEAVPRKTVTIDPEAIPYMSSITKSERNRLRKLKKKAAKCNYQSDHLAIEIKHQMNKVRELEISDMMAKEDKILYGEGEMRTNIFKHFQTFNKSHDSKPGPLIVNNVRATNDEETANMLLDQYMKVATEKPVDTPLFDENVPTVHAKMHDVSFRCKWIRKQVKRMKTRTAPGQDGVKVAMLKEGINQIVEHLKRLFTLCYERSTIPTSWRTALVTPLYKSGKKSDPSNYRPISVISNLLKLMEKVVTAAVNNHMEKMGIWSDTQFAFRDGSSVGNNLISHDLALSKIRDKGGQVTIILVDARKAYDLIGFNKILRGMKRANLPEKTDEMDDEYTNRQEVLCEGGENTLKTWSPQLRSPSRIRV